MWGLMSIRLVAWLDRMLIGGEETSEAVRFLTWVAAVVWAIIIVILAMELKAKVGMSDGMLMGRMGVGTRYEDMELVGCIQGVADEGREIESQVGE